MRYIRTYFICIRPEEMARPLMSLADAPRKTFSTPPSSFRGVPSACGNWSECVLRICQHPRATSFQSRPSTSTRRRSHTTRFIPLRIKSRVSTWVRLEFEGKSNIRAAKSSRTQATWLCGFRVAFASAWNTLFDSVAHSPMTLCDWKFDVTFLWFKGLLKAE